VSNFYQWQWDGVAVAYGRESDHVTRAVLQAARDFACLGDKPVVVFTEHEPKAVRGILFGKWPELGHRDAQDVHVLPFSTRTHSLKEHIAHVAPLACFANAPQNGVPGLVVFDGAPAAGILRQHAAHEVWQTKIPVLATKTHGPNLSTIPIPKILQFNSHALFQVSGGAVTLRKHRTISTGAQPPFFLDPDPEPVLQVPTYAYEYASTDRHKINIDTWCSVARSKKLDPGVYLIVTTVLLTGNSCEAVFDRTVGQRGSRVRRGANASVVTVVEMRQRANVPNDGSVAKLRARIASGSKGGEIVIQRVELTATREGDSP